MTTLVLEELMDDAMDMVLQLAAADPRGAAHRVARHAGVLVEWCTWHRNEDGTRGCAMGVRAADVPGLLDLTCTQCARAAATRVADHAGVLIRWCSWHWNEDGTRGRAFGVKDGEGETGITDGMCPQCQIAMRAEIYAKKARN